MAYFKSSRLVYLYKNLERSYKNPLDWVDLVALYDVVRAPFPMSLISGIWRYTKLVYGVGPLVEVPGRRAENFHVRVEGHAVEAIVLLAKHPSSPPPGQAVGLLEITWPCLGIWHSIWHGSWAHDLANSLAFYFVWVGSNCIQPSLTRSRQRQGRHLPESLPLQATKRKIVFQLDVTLPTI